MEVILNQPVHNLGEADDIIKVKPGYARNYLIPKGMAILATASNRKVLAEKQRQASHKYDFVIQQAKDSASLLSGTKITITTLAGADGKLFGSVTALMVAKQLKDSGFEVDRKMVTIDDIRQTGEYTATVHFHREVRADVEVEVVRKES